jgi:hypothetical protein
VRSRKLQIVLAMAVWEATPQRSQNFTGFHSSVQRTSQALLLSFWALAGLEENHRLQIDLLLRAKERKRDETVSFTGN